MYETNEQYPWEFLEFVRNSRPGRFQTWAEAWETWERQKSEEAQEPPLFEHEEKNPKPPDPLRLSGAETTARRKPQPDYTQFGLPGFGPRFGEVRKTSGKKKRASINQLPLGM